MLPANQIINQEKQYLNKSHQFIIDSLSNTFQTLKSYYNSAYSSLEEGKFYVNQIFIKQFIQLIEQIGAIITMNSNQVPVQSRTIQPFNNNNSVFHDKTTNQDRSNRNKNSTSTGSNPYLISIAVKDLNAFDDDQQFTTMTDLNSFIRKNRQNSHITLTKKNLQEYSMKEILLNSANLNSIQLKSHPWKQNMIINNLDLSKIFVFDKITAFDVNGSLITDSCMATLLTYFSQLKSLNISKCCLLTDTTIKLLTGNQFVNLQLNSLNSITQQAFLNLIEHSYNLNYLSIQSIKLINYQSFVIKVSQIYNSNQANFKWLEIVSDIGIDLFINKLGYMTHLITSESINDSEVAVLLGKGKTRIDGLFFSCCEELNQKTISLICQELKNLKRLKLSKFFKLNDLHVKQIVSGFSSLQLLDLGECFSLTNCSLNSISQYISNIKYLNLTQCKAITDQGIDLLCKNQNLPLQYINLSNLKLISDQAISTITRNCPNLKSLIIEKCDQITNKAVHQISQRLPQMQELVLNHCENLTDSSLCFVAIRLNNLIRLEIQWCQVTQKCIQLIASNLKKLKILNLNYCPAVYDKQILLLADNINFNLEVLKIESCDKVSESAFLRFSCSLKNLKHLDLRQCIGVTDDVVKSFCVSSQSHLKFIDLGWCKKITDKALFALSQYQQELISLNLSGCSQISDVGVEWAVSTLINLQFLSLSFCQKITDKSLCLLGQLKRLRRLYLGELKRISDVSISNLSDLTELQELQISGCYKVSSRSLIDILQNLQKLQSLNINECLNIRPEFLLVALDNIQNLKRLQLSSLQIDDNFLAHLGFHFQRLQYLNLSMCGKVTDQGLLTLIESLPSLVKVDFQNTRITKRTKQKIAYALNCRRLYTVTLY